MTRCSFGIRNVQLTLVSFLSILSSFYFKIATFGEPANEAAYEAAVENGINELQQSYIKDKSARDISAKADTICKDKDHASKSKLKHLNRERKELTEQSEVLAHNALREFRLAEAIMPERPEAIFGEGLALSQLKEYCSAIKKFEAVREANYEPPGKPAETTFALGAALVGCYDVGSKELQVGINLLEEYITRAGGYPKDACENPKDEFPNLCAANRLKNAKTYENLKKSDLGKNKEPNFARCPLPIRGNTELPFTASISSAIGYDDNVITLGRSQPLPVGTTQKESFYNESSFILGRDFSLSHPSSLSHTGWLSDTISLKYVFTNDTFDEFPQNDRLLQTVFGSYQRAFTPKIAGLLKISDQWLYIDQNISSNLFTAQEALVLTPNAWWKTLVSYYLIRTDGFAPSIPPNNPNGFTHRAELTQIFIVKHDKKDLSAVLTLTGQYGHEWREPSGIAGQLERDDFLGKLEWKAFHARNRCSFVRAVTITVSDRWQPDRYTHATFPSSTTTGLFARSDETNIVAFAMSVPMWYDRYMENAGLTDANRLEAILGYSHTTRDSNVKAKAYDQNVFLATLKLNF